MFAERHERVIQTLNRRQPDLTVVMDNVHKPHNLSAIARTCDAVGVGHIHAVVPEGKLRVGGKAASGTQKWIDAKPWRDMQAVAGELKEQGFRLYAADLSSDAIDYREIDFTRPTAVVVGAELDGVSDSARRCIDDLLTIPIYGMVESLNVSVATSILLYEAARQRQQAGMYESRRIDKEEFERLRFEWLHPSVTEYCRRRGIQYPQLDEEGNIVDPISGNARLEFDAWSNKA